MVFPWRRRKAGRLSAKKEDFEINSDMELAIPTHFRCPISLDLMKDPVTLSTGITYDRESIERWIEAGNQTCPVTNQVLRTFDQIPNHSIRKMIQGWCVENRCNGIERIPTPRIPVTPYEVSEICTSIMAATQRGDERRCRESVGKIKAWAKDSERNKTCILDNGAGRVLAASFDHFASVSMEKHACLLEEILSALTWMFPLGEEGQCKLGSTSSLRCMAWFLKGEDLSAKKTAALALRELLSLDNQHVNGLMKIEGILEDLFKTVEDPICPMVTKASLVIIYHMITQQETGSKLALEFVEMGLVALILEILVDSERSLCEKALAVLDRICSHDEGRREARNHALTMPVLVKKILRVSALATEFSISILLKMGKDEDGSAVVEALQVGAFQKVLVVLQVGCGEMTKVKATELLKLMNRYKDRLDCFGSSMDFKYLKRT
ncbi:hypothetical protein RJ639_028748 [Escallonia herrerae]|uniref:U-box domain-containing protein n=1 Tax=Escallonia herrerae TaxID=1293975 RepID=A0AA88X3R0_9ASTE|nr:hypothetical protein RJ639_028748 [Escallonia herrerae]